MNWLNLETRMLHATEYIGCEPVARATWLNLMLWCAEQENSGIIAGARDWRDRRWQQTCGVTAAEVASAKPLLQIVGDDVVVAFYPLAQQETVFAKRKIAQDNGKLGGRPAKPKPILEPTLVPTLEPILKPISESVKERKGREDIAPAKPTRARNPVLEALATIDGSALNQITKSAWGAAASALKDIVAVCVDVTSEEIARRAKNYRLHMPEMTISPKALAKHWAKCDRPPQPAGEPQRTYNVFQA